MSGDSFRAAGGSGDDHTAAVIGAVQRVFDVRGVSPDTPIAELGADSQAILRLNAALEDTFDIGIDIVDMFTAQSVADLVALTRGTAS